MRHRQDMRITRYVCLVDNFNKHIGVFCFYTLPLATLPELLVALGLSTFPFSLHWFIYHVSVLVKCNNHTAFVCMSLHDCVLYKGGKVTQ